MYSALTLKAIWPEYGVAVARGTLQVGLACKMGVLIIERAEEQPVSEVFRRAHAAILADANPALVAHFIRAITLAETAILPEDSNQYGDEQGPLLPDEIVNAYGNLRQSETRPGQGQCSGYGTARCLLEGGSSGVA